MSNSTSEYHNVDFDELMGYLSVPRLNGSQAERQTRSALLNWLKLHDIPNSTQTFRLYPHFFVAIGIWLIVSRSLLALAIWLRWGAPAFWIAGIGLLGGLVDVGWGFPLVSWVGARQGQNILIKLEPDNPRQEIIFSAHFDSKTELLDHQQRMFFIKNLRWGILLTILLGLLGPLDHWLLATGSRWATFTYWLGVALSLPLLLLAWGIGLNMSLGRLRTPSQGAVDNGAACAILLALATHVKEGHTQLNQTRLTLALFTGEEVNMQGSRAYTSQRSWDLPALAVNLEVMAQDGDYVYWEWEGSSLMLVPTNEQINHAVSEVIEQINAKQPLPGGPVNSDGYSFLRAGIPATTIGTYDRVQVDRGFHGPADNLDRVVMERLPQAVQILARFVEKYDRGEYPFPDPISKDQPLRKIYSYPKGGTP